MQKIFLSFSVFILLWGCKEKAAPARDVKQYSIEQFYKTEGVSGGAFNKDETKILINSNVLTDLNRRTPESKTAFDLSPESKITLSDNLTD